MFDFVRTHQRLAQGLLLVLIMPAFVFFGISGYDRMFGDGDSVASVDGEPVPRAYFEQTYRQQRTPQGRSRSHEHRGHQNQCLDEKASPSSHSSTPGYRGVSGPDSPLHSIHPGNPLFQIADKGIVPMSLPAIRARPTISLPHPLNGKPAGCRNRRTHRTHRIRRAASCRTEGTAPRPDALPRSSLTPWCPWANAA